MLSGSRPSRGVSRADADDEISGLIERVTFHNEDTGFSVLKVKVSKRRELVTVVGALPGVNAGEWVIARGTWVQDRDHGRQLQAESIRASAPESIEGIEKYLGSGLIKGIGPVYAAKLVSHFGARVLDVIDGESARLEEVAGIGGERRRSIREAWRQQKAVRDIMVFLHSHGVGTSRALRIYKTYGDEAIDRVRADPYLLARHIRGIGFKSADQIAGKLGIAGDSPLRLRAGLEHLLAEASGDGHCALPRGHLLAAATALLDVGTASVESALAASLESGLLERDTGPDGEFIYLPPLRFAERVVARRLLELARLSPVVPEIDVEKAIAWVQEKTAITLSASQREALALALCSPAAVITGGPGVGKTTLLKSILRIVRAKRVRCVLAAPTGRAAKRLSESTGLPASTLHRLLEAGGDGSFGRDEKRPLDGDLFVVDESSMIDMPLMARFLRALPRRGGLILVGDADQLPSVGPGRLLADLIESRILPVASLTEIHRQSSGSGIVRAAHAMRSGLAPEPGTPGESDFYFIEKEDPAEIAETVVKLVAERIPGRWKDLPASAIQVLAPMHRGVVGVGEMNRRLQDALNPRNEFAPGVERFGMEFRAGDRVIQLQNDYDKEVFNGDIGTIARIDAEAREVRADFDGRTVVYDFGELDELAPAYAITVHKSQGSEFPAVVIPLAMQQYLLLQRNLLYTAITRGRRLVVVVGQRKALLAAIRNARPAERTSLLLERLRGSVD